MSLQTPQELGRQAQEGHGGVLLGLIVAGKVLVAPPSLQSKQVCAPNLNLFPFLFPFLIPSLIPFLIPSLIHSSDCKNPV